MLGMTILFIPPLVLNAQQHYFQLEREFLAQIVNACISTEYALRSFGRMALLRVIRCAKSTVIKRDSGALIRSDFTSKTMPEYQ
jgi:putative effector of murein hydrolase LrgA (UPF0299 family)